MINLGILGSTRGSSMLAILDAIQQKQLNAKIALVVSNKSDAFILGRAQSHGLSACFINPAGLKREAYDNEISSVLTDYKVDLVVLIGYMRILSSEFVQFWQQKIINVHPSLLPAHAGKMDLDVHRAVISAKEKKTGCTIHYVTDDVDAGPVIVQKTCSVYPSDTPQELKQRVQALEGPALIEAIASYQI